MNIKSIICKLGITFITLYQTNLNAQIKFEKEERVNVSEVPKKAFLYVDSLTKQKKIKWYREINSYNTSYEAKCKWNKRYWSMEFDSSGNFEDIEILIKYNQLPDSVKKILLSILDSFGNNYKIEKVQQQITDKNNVSLFFANKSKIIPNNYELEVTFYENYKLNKFELLINSQGNLINKKKIIYRNEDNLEF